MVVRPDMPPFESDHAHCLGLEFSHFEKLPVVGDADWLWAGSWPSTDLAKQLQDFLNYWDIQSIRRRQR